MRRDDKPLVWLSGEIKTPPMSKEARFQAGYLLRRVQGGEKLSMPDSRPMPAIGRRCHEIRISDRDTWWRIIYRTDKDAIVIGEVFQKKRNDTPKAVIRECKRRFREYDNACG